MSISPGQIADLKYGVFYLPSLIYAYLIFKPTPPSFTFLGATLPHPNVYPLATLLTLIWAVYLHNLSISIFGYEGPTENPKTVDTIYFYMLPLVWPNRLHNWEIENYDSNREIISKLVEDTQSWDLSKFVRAFVLIITISLGYLFFYYSIFDLTYYILHGSADYIGGILWLAMAVFFIHGHIDRSFPPVGNVDAASRINQPEYKRFQDLVSEADSNEVEGQTESSRE